MAPDRGFPSVHPSSPTALLAALHQTMAMAEFLADGSLVIANPRYLELLGYTAEAAALLTHEDFCDPAFARSTAYRSFWATLMSGQPVSGVCERRRRDGGTCWLQATYSPLRSAQGEIIRVLVVATDITQQRLRQMALLEHTRRLSLVADTTDTAVVIGSGGWRIEHVNPGFTRLFGWRADELPYPGPLGLPAPHVSPTQWDAVRAELKAGRPVRHEDILVGKNGQRYWVNAMTNPVIDESGQLINTVSVLTDVTQTKMYEVLQHRALEAMAREQPLTQVLDTVCREVERIVPEITASILSLDEHGCLQPLAAPGLPESYLIAVRGLAIGPAVGACGTAAYRNAPVLSRDIATDPSWPADFRAILVPLGFVACWSTPIRSSEGGVVGTFAFYFRDDARPDTFLRKIVNACAHLCGLALERERQRVRIRQLAFYDTLTGLPNRSLLFAQADQAVRAARHANDSLAVLFLDLDRFKQVNDSLGHPAGDALLRTVATRLGELLGAADFAGRLSGDEFVIVLPQRTAPQAEAIAARIVALLGEPSAIAGISLACSGSIGIAMFPTDGEDMETLLQSADMAMYQAKSAGRGQVAFFSPGMNEAAQERLALETALREALAQRTLELHYQPQILMDAGTLHGVEALARWPRSRWGNVPPSRFIPLAEDAGIMGALSAWVLDEACRQLAAWRADGLAVPAMSINLSPTSFQDLDLPASIRNALTRHGLQAADLTLEITEGIMLNANASTLRTMAEIRALGVQLSMDDFGTGYSSLSYLRRLPVNELKLDRSFVAELEQDATARTLSAGILGLAHSLGLKLVAEGVETPAQRRVLQSQGYAVAQGAIYTMPLPAAALVAWLQAHGVCMAPMRTGRASARTALSSDHGLPG
ncbi:EAL domain-containing protein [Achromobacter sp. GG226]|uniref:bifunctional diguanylate cyclase/phosphodiesterase n=1 Tax=Verticiella alkaliphila TaxID=2779529 RepID=UPI001C0B2460|nr:EAL domain-containing protein [Verticiella sp. GG226]MBU4609698.1 EAL domain-containing protein [Verticiella sp. GG226]